MRTTETGTVGDIADSNLLPVDTPRPTRPRLTTAMAGLLACGSWPCAAFPVSQWLRWRAARRPQLRGQPQLRANALTAFPINPGREPSPRSWARRCSFVNSCQPLPSKRGMGPTSPFERKSRERSVSARLSQHAEARPVRAVAPFLTLPDASRLVSRGWESVIRFGIRSVQKWRSRQAEFDHILSRRSPRGTGHIDHAICDRRRGNLHQNSHGQSRGVGSLDGKSRRGTRSSSIRQIRRKLRQAIPSPMGYPSPSSMDHTGHTRGNTLENNKDSLASERG